MVAARKSNSPPLSPVSPTKPVQNVALCPLLLTRQMRAYQVRSLGKLPGGNLNSLSSLCISAWIVRCTPFTSGAIECRELRRAYPPITPLLPGYDMEVEVWCFLSTIDPVVLKREYSERPISLDEGLCESLRRSHYHAAFRGRKIEQRRRMPSCDDATLAKFKLPGINHGECMFGFIYHRPSLFATCHPFTKIARFLYGELDHLCLLKQ